MTTERLRLVERFRIGSAPYDEDGVGFSGVSETNNWRTDLSDAVLLGPHNDRRARFDRVAATSQSWLPPPSAAARPPPGRPPLNAKTLADRGDPPEVGAMLTPIRARDTIDIPFASNVVWPVLRDLTGYPRWWPASLRLRVVAVGVEGLGTEFEVRPPASRPFRCRVEELSEGRWIKMSYHSELLEGSGLLRLEASYGGSRVTYELDVRARGWLVALLARFIDLGSIHSRQMRDVLQHLERTVREQHQNGNHQ